MLHGLDTPGRNWTPCSVIFLLIIIWRWPWWVNRFYCMKLVWSFTCYWAYKINICCYLFKYIHEFQSGKDACVGCVALKPIQGSKFHLSNHPRWVKMTVGQVEYLQDLSDGRLRISDFHISCIGYVYFRQVNGTFGQVIFTIHLPDRQVHSIWNFEACNNAVPSHFLYQY